MNSQIYSRVILAREYEAIMDLKKNCSFQTDVLLKCHPHDRNVPRIQQVARQSAECHSKSFLDAFNTPRSAI